MLTAQHSTLGSKQSTDSLDKYAYERPLDSARRHSRLSESSLNLAGQGHNDRRLSRLPSQFDMLDPFGYGLTSTASPFDAAASASARSSTPSLPPSPSQRSTRSLYAANGVASTSALSLGSRNGSSSQLSPPPAWQPVKPRSQSFGDAGGALRAGSAGRSASRGSYLHPGPPRSQGGLAPPPLSQNRSKLSGEINLDSDAPDSPGTADGGSSLPFSMKSATGANSAENYAHLAANSSFNKRVQKAQKALEKERAKAAAKDAKLGRSASSIRPAKEKSVSAPAALKSSAASIAPSVRSNRSTMSSRLSSIFGGGDRSRAPSESTHATPPSPSPSQASHFTQGVQGKRDSNIEEVIDEAVYAAAPQSPMQAQRPLTPKLSMPTLVATPASPVKEQADPLADYKPADPPVPEVKLPDTPPMTAKPALASEAAPVAECTEPEPGAKDEPKPATAVLSAEVTVEPEKELAKKEEPVEPPMVDLLTAPEAGALTEEPSPIERATVESAPAAPPAPVEDATETILAVPASSISVPSSPSGGLLPSAFPESAPTSPRLSTSSPRPSISESIGARSTRSQVSLTPSGKPRKKPTINLAVITGQEPGALSTMSVPPPESEKALRRKSSFGAILGALGGASSGAKKSEERAPPTPKLPQQRGVLSKSQGSSTSRESTASSVFSSLLRSRKQSAPAATARRPSEPKWSAIPLTSTAPPVSPDPNLFAQQQMAPKTADSNASSATAVATSPERSMAIPSKHHPQAAKGMSKSRSAGEKFFAKFGRNRSKSSPAPPVPRPAQDKDLPPVPALPNGAAARG